MKLLELEIGDAVPSLERPVCVGSEERGWISRDLCMREERNAISRGQTKVAISWALEMELNEFGGRGSC